MENLPSLCIDFETSAKTRVVEETRYTDFNGLDHVRRQYHRRDQCYSSCGAPLGAYKLINDSTQDLLNKRAVWSITTLGRWYGTRCGRCGTVFVTHEKAEDNSRPNNGPTKSEPRPLFMPSVHALVLRNLHEFVRKQFPHLQNTINEYSTQPVTPYNGPTKVQSLAEALLVIELIDPQGSLYYLQEYLENQLAKQTATQELIHLRRVATKPWLHGESSNGRKPR